MNPFLTPVQKLDIREKTKTKLLRAGIETLKDFCGKDNNYLKTTGLTNKEIAELELELMFTTPKEISI